MQTYIEHVEASATALQEIYRLDHLDSQLNTRDAAAVAEYRAATVEATRKYIAADAAAADFCAAHGIDDQQFDRDVEVCLLGP